MRCIVIGFLLGVSFLQTQARLPSALLVCILLFAAILAGLLATKCSRRFLTFSALIAVGAILGFCWAALYAHYYLQQELPVEWEGRDVTVVGTIDNLPTYFEQGVRFDFLVEKVLPQNGESPPIPSKLALSWYRPFKRAGKSVGNLNSADQSPQTSQIGQIEPGARWQLTVRLKRPHGNANPYGFDYEVWLLEQNLRATGYVRTPSISAASVDAALNNRQLDRFVFSFGHLVEATRGWVRQRMLLALPDKKYVGILIALVIGDQRAVNQDHWTVFNRTGVGHLISISGLHITLIAGLFAAMMSALWRRSFFMGNSFSLFLPAQKAALLAGATTALLYALLAGFGLPAQRTLYMLLMVALALWTGRISSVSHVLCAALFVVLLRDPWAVLAPGFWLSFGAVAMILYASVGRTKPLEDTASLLPAKPARTWLSSLTSSAYTQYVVTIGLVPLTILLFGQISLVSPIANAIAIPLVGLLVTPLALIGSLLPAPLSVWVLIVAHTLVEWLALALMWLSSFPMAVWQAPLPPAWTFVVAMIATLWLLAPRGWPLRWLALFGWLPLLLQSETRPAAGEMVVTAFDVGQGMGLLIETGQHRLLYDTGPYYSPGSDAGSRVIVPYLKARGINRLDTVVISHSDNDHSGGALSVFDAIDVGRVYSSLPPNHRIVAAAPAHTRCQDGQSWSWDGVQFDMLFPAAENYTENDRKAGKANTMSCTLKITNGAYSILLPGDIEKAQERQLILTHADKLNATVLLAPHHGSGTSSTLGFLQKVDPTIALFQLGYRNRFRHPKAQVLERYQQLAIDNYRNDQSGAIILRFGSTLDVTAYRQQHQRYWYGR
ncbi:DNA internalization-related competence protein ComEC/Rec2 [Glaciimonas sp. PCH181]|uniref:DNA internalization-related competence protein ComEC/Rec2 n=1 Tax=Glaciimonas sp. PCH181 TaxID=2133943 RepID=UPI000D357A1E|nr:DNA internalization-related competence protein ComEC/Rec2 [Glaciimonas sp. PCH181]PUA19474.1 DNA internalization-related competence protein ComEC/Rec2 [Glaciimonas sp. PCH181]